MSNYYDSNANTRDTILKRFSMFDGVGIDLRDATDYDDALWRAGIDYSAVKLPLFTEDGVRVPQHYAAVKSDDPSRVLGIVGNQYRAVANRDAFAVAAEIVSEGHANYEVGGPSIRTQNSVDFAKSFMVLRSDDFYVNDDAFNTFIIFNNSFDGTSGVQFRVVCQRVVCLNGMVRLLGGKKRQLHINIQHTRSAEHKIKLASQIVKEKHEEILKIKAEAEAFINTRMTRADFENIVIPFILEEKGLVETQKDRIRGHERVDRIVRELLQAYEADDVQNYANSAYRAILAVSDFETHSAPLRDTGNGHIYMNRITQGMVLTSALATHLAAMHNIHINQ